MRTGVTRAVLRSEVQIEAGLSTATGHDTQHAARINQLLNRLQRKLAMEHTWRPLTGEQEVTVPADAAEGSLPTNFVFTKINDVWCKLGSKWLPVEYGIDRQHRSTYGPDARSSPIMRWEIKYPGDEKFFVWPVSSVDEVLRFTGERTVTEMDDDSDECELDADVLVLLAAGELLSKRDPDQAALKLQEANSMIEAIDRRIVGRKRVTPVNMTGKRQYVGRPYIDFIPPG